MKTYTTVDKSEWPERGPWNDEPDKAQWIDEDAGLDCLIVRGPMGALCGYVGIPESHSGHGKHYCDFDVSVHGGLTFSGSCSPSDDESHGICHSGKVANENVWWLGFDCAHLYDLAPAYIRLFSDPLDVYRDFNYVKSETENLARQLA